MGQVAFLRALVETGQVKVGPVVAPAAVDQQGNPAGGPAAAASLDRETQAVLDVIREWDAANRLEFPGDAPPLVAATALRAIDRFYRACQFTVYRDVDAETVAELFAEPVTDPRAGPPTPADHYTVDLVFRFLPELIRLARRASKADPLGDGLRQWAAAWPLSSIGVAGVNPAGMATLLSDGGLLRLYAERVITRRDAARLADPLVRAAVRTALGYYDDLCPPIARALESFDAPAPGSTGAASATAN